jgi:hypothetical protein
VIAARIHPGIAVLVALACVAAALYFFAQLPAQHSSYQSGAPAPMPSVTALPQSNTHAPDVIKPTVPALASETNVLSDHGPGRVACDAQWGTLHRNDSEYRDFIVNCMKNKNQ